MVELGVQLLLVLLLVLTIAWCVIVHHRLRRLRADRGEMAEFVAALDTAIARAEDMIGRMREAGIEAEAVVREAEERARGRAQELQRAVDGGARLLRRLDASGVREPHAQAEPRGCLEPETVAPVPLRRAASDGLRSTAELPLAAADRSELLEALKALR